MLVVEARFKFPEAGDCRKINPACGQDRGHVVVDRVRAEAVAPSATLAVRGFLVDASQTNDASMAHSSGVATAVRSTLSCPCGSTPQIRDL